MFKKIGVLTILLLYLITASGFALNLHYCGNKIASVKIDLPAKQSSAAKMACKMKCCKDKHVVVKVKDAHQGQSSSLLTKIFSIELPRLPFEDYVLSAQRALLDEFFDSGPPGGPCDTPIYIKNGNLRI